MAIVAGPFTPMGGQAARPRYGWCRRGRPFSGLCRSPVPVDFPRRIFQKGIRSDPFWWSLWAGRGWRLAGPFLCRIALCPYAPLPLGFPVGRSSQASSRVQPSGDTVPTRTPFADRMPETPFADARRAASAIVRRRGRSGSGQVTSTTRRPGRPNLALRRAASVRARE